MSVMKAEVFASTGCRIYPRYLADEFQEDMTYMKTGVLIFLVVFIAGCVSSGEIHDSEGQLAYSIDCSGISFDWGLCYVEAGEICREKGYEVLETSGDTSGAAEENQPGTYYGIVTNRKMTIQCNS